MFETELSRRSAARVAKDTVRRFFFGKGPEGRDDDDDDQGGPGPSAVAVVTTPLFGALFGRSLQPALA
jgi:hypothetical protein